MLAPTNTFSTTCHQQPCKDERQQSPTAKHTYQCPYHADDKGIYTAFCYKEHFWEIPALFLVIMGRLCITGLLIILRTKQ